jgi:molybdopterin converting factor small subunit
MRIGLLYFGVLKDWMGAADESVVVASGTTVGGVLEILRTRTSNRGMEEGMWMSLAVAVNREYAGAEVELREGDEVALLPPVSGGCFRGRWVR